MPISRQTTHDFFAQGTVLTVFVVLFAVAVGAVFFGFIGYYSRVNLSKEQGKDGASIDFLMMSVKKFSDDEKSLAELRLKKNDLEKRLNSTLDRMRAEASTSAELEAFFAQKAGVVTLFYQSRAGFTDEYWKEAATALFSNAPDEFERELVTLVSPVFRPDVPPEGIKTFYDLLTPALYSTLQAFRAYNLKHRQPQFQFDLTAQIERDPIANGMREIFSGYPQLATVEDRRSFLGIEPVDSSTSQKMAQLQAVLRSFDNLFVGGTRAILEWPTIASTLLVTLATGWLGGLVNFMGASASAGTGGTTTLRASLAGLLRRSFLGITAALGIFLFAGSGLLVLTAQSTNAASGTPIELSPYFVAFLAFISGFLADDAFSRLTVAGRTLFSSKDNDEEEKKD